MIKLEKIFFNVTFVFSIVVLFSILLINMNTFYWADDYAFMNAIKKNGLLQNCINGYFEWDGRFLSIGAFVQGLLLKFFKIEFVTLFYNLCFLASGYFGFIFIQKEQELKITSAVSFFLATTTAIVFWFGCKILLAQTIYWGTGGVYSFDLLLGAIWLLSYQKIKLTQSKVLYKTAFLFFTFFVASTSQNFSIGFVTLLIIDIVIKIIKKDKILLSFYFATLLILIVGILFLLLAPGNAIRMSEIGGLDIKGLTFKDLCQNFYDVTHKYFVSLKLLILVVATIGFSFRLFCYQKISNILKIKFRFVNINDFLVLFLINSKWLFIALSTITPFIVMPMMAAERTMIFFAFFIAIFILNLFLSEINVQNFKMIIPKFIPLLILAVLSCFVLDFSLKNFKKGQILKEIISKREDAFINSRNKDVAVKIIPHQLKSPCYDFYDFVLNLPQDHFIILGHREYYNVKKITVIE